MRKGNHQGENPYYVGLNGKVLEYTWPEEKPANYDLYMKYAGFHLEYMVAINMYDPKYGCPTSIDKFLPEHRDIIEDIIMTFRGPGPHAYGCGVVALL